MAGRRLCSDIEAVARGYGGAEATRRRAVLRETIAAFDHVEPPDHFHRLAEQNLEHWRSQRGASDPSLRIAVLAGDWGDVALQCTRTYGVRFAVLNGAFGCGAFRNPPREVARIYTEEIVAREAHFSLIAFAIFSAGYGPDNYQPFAEVLAPMRPDAGGGA